MRQRECAPPSAFRHLPNMPADRQRRGCAPQGGRRDPARQDQHGDAARRFPDAAIRCSAGPIIRGMSRARRAAPAAARRQRLPRHDAVRNRHRHAELDPAAGRISAAYIGLKPTENRVSLEGGFPNPGNAPRTIHIMSCIGTDGAHRRGSGAALQDHCRAGRGATQTCSPCRSKRVPALEVKGLRIAYALTFPGFPVAAEIRAAVEGLARKLSRRRCGRRGGKAAGAGLPCTTWRRAAR